MTKTKTTKTELTESAKAVYDRLTPERESYITRAVSCASFTIPSLFPDESDNSSTDYETPMQSVGARGVNNLSAKLLLALLPPNSPFFKLSINAKTMAKLLEMGTEVKQKSEQALMQQEQQILKYIENRQIRVTVKEGLNQLIVAGNCLMYLPPKEGGAKLYRLNNYVVQRDALGRIIQIVACDNLSFATVPREVQTLIMSDGVQRKPEEVVIIYTHVYLDDTGNFKSYQEVEEHIIPGSEQSYPLEKTPWIPMRMVKIDGESYGRSYVEEYLGDLKTLDGLQEAILNYSAIASHILYLCNPNGITQAKRLAKASTGAFVSGRKQDIEILQLEKSHDMGIVKQTIDAIEARISFAFMLNSAVQRSGERVTAEEIRYVAGELEDVLGGTYSILSQELQLPLVRRLMVQLQAQGEIPDLPEGTVEPTITTGLEALGRGHDLNKLQMFKQAVADIPGAMEEIHLNAWLLMFATSLGIDTIGLFKTPEEKQQEQQQAQQAQMMQSVAPNIAKGAVDGLNQQQQQLAQGAEQPQQ